MRSQPYDEDVGIDESLVQEIVRRLLTVVQPDKIILFGSAATGKMTRDSDIDLLIVRDKPDTSAEAYLTLRDTLRGLGYPFDVFQIDTERFEETKDIFGGLAFPTHKYG